MIKKPDVKSFMLLSWCSWRIYFLSSSTKESTPRPTSKLQNHLVQQVMKVNVCKECWERESHTYDRSSFQGDWETQEKAENKARGIYIETMILLNKFRNDVDTLRYCTARHYMFHAQYISWQPSIITVKETIKTLLDLRRKWADLDIFIPSVYWSHVSSLIFQNLEKLYLGIFWVEIKLFS